MIEAQDVHSYYGTAQVLSGVSLKVEEGEFLALLGRNGIGKTTLVRSLSGIRPPTMKQGLVLFGGEDVSGLPSNVIARRGLGLVPQGRHIFGSLTVEENLTVIARGADGPDAWDLDRVYDFFPRLGERRANRGVNLSGGEQQMLAIGRALMTNPQLLMMDEPSEGLAPTVLVDIRERLHQLRGTGLSLFLVEQNLKLAMSIADRVCILGGLGQLVWEGTPAELEQDADAKRLHLGV